MKKLFAYSLVVCSLFAAGSIHAQERTAGNATDVQMTWSSLNSLVNSVKARTEVVNSRVDQVVVCGKKGMVYAPGATGADSDGCVEASKSGDLVSNITKLYSMMAAINTSVTNLTNTQSTVNNSVNNIIACNKANQIFNGTSCVAAPSSAIRGTLCGVTSYSSEEGKPLVFACNGIDPKNGCPAGWASVYAPIRGGGHGQSLGYCVKL